MNLRMLNRKNPETGKIEPYYQVMWREAGRGSPQRSLALGFVSQATAQKALEKMKARRVLDMEPAPVPAPVITSGRSLAGPRVIDLWGSIEEPWPHWPPCRMRDYYEARGVRPKTLRAADTARRTFLPFIGGLLVSALNGAVLDRLIIDLRDKELAPKSIENYLMCLGTSLRLAYEEGLLPKLLKIPPIPQDEEGEPLYLTAEEVALLYEALPPGNNGLLIRFTETLFTRSGESMHARWENLVRDRSGVFTAFNIRPCALPNGSRWAPKTRPRTVQIPAELGRHLRDEWLQQGQPKEGWIFPSRDNPMAPRTDFRKALWGACERAGLPELHPHSLRHTGASRFAAAGATVAEIMAAGGWSSPEVPMRIYAHAHPDNLAAAAHRAEVRADQHTGLISTDKTHVRQNRR